MSPDGYPRSPRLFPGAFVQLLEDIVGLVPNIVAFQYNPETVTRSLQPWNPFEVDQADRGAQAPTVQPYAPEETFSFTLDYHAADGMEAGNPLATGFGVLPQISALRKLTQPSEGLLGDLVASAKALAGNPGAAATRPTVPITLLILGPGLITPVRLTSISVEQKQFNPLLYPIHATVALEMTVLTPDVFKCRHTVANDAAIACYNFTRTQEDALALANIANSVLGLAGPLPL
ncbi:hypothetical protein [Oceanicella sp. SM1341]|uniref:hypothetical protein n=1 Tax=Oceanicella sp. SM1341 TaxID=1548889 RepID=UPI000E4E9BB6|nr:hypothetical protein [Oceanicella sp. SM1341]